MRFACCDEPIEERRSATKCERRDRPDTPSFQFEFNPARQPAPGAAKIRAGTTAPFPRFERWKIFVSFFDAAASAWRPRL